MTRPNILLLSSPTSNGQTPSARPATQIIRTPNLDRLGREGTIFTSAYTPVARLRARPLQPDHRAVRSSHRLYRQLRLHAGGPAHLHAGACRSRLPHPRHRQDALHPGYRRRCAASRAASTRRRYARGMEDDDYLQFLQAKGFGHVHDPFGPAGRDVLHPPARPDAGCACTARSGWATGRWTSCALPVTSALLPLRQLHPSAPAVLAADALEQTLPRRPDAPAQAPGWLRRLQTYVNRFQNRYKYRDSGHGPEPAARYEGLLLRLHLLHRLTRSGGCSPLWRRPAGWRTR